MKSKVFFLLACVVFYSVFLIISEAQENVNPSKTVFLNKKCNTCHSITIEGITLLKKGNAPDLSDIGTKVKADFIKQFLKKEVKLNNKLHLIRFPGTDTELDSLASWLVSLKPVQK
ncbi:MAG: hypothetical protein WCT77_10295 [Bacteroidota bacterium]|jgi:hypothetical protein